MSQHVPSMLQLAGLAIALLLAFVIHPYVGLAALAVELFVVGLALERR